jgi:hypothetical protein
MELVSEVSRQEDGEVGGGETMDSRNRVKTEGAGEAVYEFEAPEDLVGLRFPHDVKDCKRKFEVMWCRESLFVGVFSTDLLRSACRES